MRIWTARGPEPLLRLPDGDWEVHYDNDLERGKRARRDFAHPFFDDDAARWSGLTDLDGLEHDPSLHGGGLQVMSPGGYLAPHLDFSHHPVVPGRVRALSVVAFVNEEWELEWGGALTFYSPDGTPVRRVYPSPNLVVAFECTDLSYHGVERVTGLKERITLSKCLLLPAGRTRAVFLPTRTPQ